MMQVKNIIAVDDAGKVNLDKFVKRYSKESSVSYEPEQFPGLFVRLTEPKCSVTLFSSGKMITTGTNTFEDAERSLRKVRKMVKELYTQE